jgi:hypothetical protein
MMHLLLMAVLVAAAPASAPAARSGPEALPPPATAGGWENAPVAIPKSGGGPAEKPPAAPAAPADEPPASQGSRAPVGIEDLKALYKESDFIVQFQVESVQAKTDVNPRLTWEVRGPVLEVTKGVLLPGQISVHVDSVLRAFDMPRNAIEGKQFVVAVKPLGDAAARRFQLVGAYAFLSDSNEAKALRQLASADVEKGSGGQTLDLVVRPLQPAYPVSGPKTIEIRLTNTGSDSATYLQTPITEKEGRLYLTGQGMIRIRDIAGRIVPDKGNVTVGQPPPPPPTPALVLPKASFVETVDLSKYFELSEGRYTLMVTLAAPDGRGRISSNGFSFQVGAVNLPAAPKSDLPGTAMSPAATVERPLAPEKPPVTALPDIGPIEPPLPPARRVVEVQLPDPAKYQPGKPSAGLAGLLRPATKGKFALGDPVELEFRLINTGARSIAIDARLERTLTIQVQQVGDSPQPLFARQVISWPADAGPVPEERAFLKEGAFWGRTINLNMLFGKALDDLPAPTPEEVAAGKGLSYERFGKNLFGFPKPGIYTVTATYAVLRPAKPAASADSAKEPTKDAPKEWWVGDLQTNSITIQVGEPGK